MEQVRAERQELLDGTKQEGVSTGFSGWRVSLKGRRFCMHDAVRLVLISARTLFVLSMRSPKGHSEASALAGWPGAVEHRLAG